MRIPALVVFAFFLCIPAHLLADTATYVYTGNDFTTVNAPYTTSDFISGSVTIAAPLAPNLYAYEVPYWDLVSFDFTDGVEEFDEANRFYPYFGFSTDATGAIIRWFVSISTPSTTIQFCNDCSYGPPEDSAQDGGYTTLSYNLNDQGTWTMEGDPAPAPEPGALLLTGTGLIGLLPLARRRTGF